MRPKTFIIILTMVVSAGLFLAAPMSHATDPDLEVWCCRDAALMGAGPCTTEELLLAKKASVALPAEGEEVLADYKAQYLAQAESYKNFENSYQYGHDSGYSDDSGSSAVTESETPSHTKVELVKFDKMDLQDATSEALEQTGMDTTADKAREKKMMQAMKQWKEDEMHEPKVNFQSGSQAEEISDAELDAMDAEMMAEDDPDMKYTHEDFQLAQNMNMEPKSVQSGYTEQELTADVKDQDMDYLRSRSKIDESYIEAKSIKLNKGTKPDTSKDPVPVIQTDEEIIRSLIKQPYKDKRIDLDFDEVKLSDIFMTLGKAADVNVVIDPAYKSLLLDLHLKQVTLEEAFILIGNAYDLGFKRVSQSLYVTGKEKIKSENSVSKVLKLKNVSVKEAETLVEDLVDNISISEELNSIIVTGDPKMIQDVEAILYGIDKPQPQVILEAKIIEVNKDALKELGVDWQDEIRISSQEGGRPLDLDDDENPSSSIYRIARFQRTPLQFETAIKMLENQNKAKILSNPRVSTLNDKEAEIFVGDRLPYTVTNVAGGVVTTEVRWVEPGIRLTITPSIIEDDFVVIKVEPEVSFIFAFRGPNDEFPHVKTREATAFVRVEDRQPFVLGGLLSQEDKANLFKVPFLGDVPLLGNLFSYEQNTITDTELIITITPTIVHGQQ